MGEERGAAVRAHAVERWADLGLSDCAELVARRAGSGEERLALLGIARLFDVRGECRDDVVLRPARGAERIEVARRLCCDLAIGVRPQPCDVVRAEVGGGDLAVLQRRQERERRLRPANDLIEDRRRVALGERGDEHGVDVAAGILGQRRDQLRFEGVGCCRLDKGRSDSGQRTCALRGTARRLAASSARRSSLVPGAASSLSNAAP